MGKLQRKMYTPVVMNDSMKFIFVPQNLTVSSIFVDMTFIAHES